MGNTQHSGFNLKKISQKKGGLWLPVNCDICTELISLPNKMFKNQNKCAHPICVNCMIKYINAKLDSRMARIKCPSLDCGHHLDPLSCRPIIPALVFDRWCDLLCESAILKIDRCYCPYRECSVLILNECAGSPVESKCPKCKKLFCFSCQVAWHQGYSCKEVKRDWHDVASRVLAENKKWKRCPACRHCVELISGCSIVKCRCGISFCYRSGRKVNYHVIHTIFLSLLLSLPIIIIYIVFYSYIF